MVRYLLGFEYVGTAFRGAARVPIDSPIPGVQNVLESALTRLNNGNQVKTVLSSRTDADVHALCNTAHVDINRAPEKPDLDTETIKNATNHYVRRLHPLRVHTVCKVDERFHARRYASRRVYVYRIAANCKFPNVFEKERSYNIAHRLDLGAMQEAVRVFQGTHDFTTFSSVSDSGKQVNSIKTISRAEVGLGKPFPLQPPDCNTQHIEVTIESKSFLYHQVRLMVGALIAAGSCKASPSDIQDLIGVRDRRRAPRMAPGYGLYLTRVDYDTEQIEYDK
ncbi:tRNA pseudouridine synthase-like 1 isoform X2 [Oscarella lobularis]|uniref:tRNA pseudouridine synthase-like 1 isoform X2 n=1 Tax=Oscarella lobularis TaxID=121494 RepID=UPI003313E9B2